MRAIPVPLCCALALFAHLRACSVARSHRRSLIVRHLYNGLEAGLLVATIAIVLAGGLFQSTEFSSGQPRFGLTLFVYAVLATASTCIVLALLWDTVRGVRIALSTRRFAKRFGRVR